MMLKARHLTAAITLCMIQDIHTAQFENIAKARLASKYTEVYFTTALFSKTHQMKLSLENSTIHATVHEWPMLDRSRMALTELEDQIRRNEKHENRLPKTTHNNRIKRSAITDAATGASIIGGVANRYSITTLQDKLETATNTDNALIHVAEDTVQSVQGLHMDVNQLIKGISYIEKETTNFEFSTTLDRRLAVHIKSLTQQLKSEEEEYLSIVENKIPHTTAERNEENLIRFEERLKNQHYTLGQSIMTLLLLSGTSYYIERRPLGIRAVLHAELLLSDIRRPQFQAAQLTDRIFRSNKGWRELTTEQTVLIYNREAGVGTQLTKSEWTQCILQGSIHFCKQRKIKRLKHLCLFNLMKRTGDYSQCAMNNATNTVLTRNDVTAVLITGSASDRAYTKYLDDTRGIIEKLRAGPKVLTCQSPCSVMHSEDTYYIDNTKIIFDNITDEPQPLHWKHEPALIGKNVDSPHTIEEALEEMARLTVTKAKEWGIARRALKGLHKRDQSRQQELRSLKKDVHAAKEAASNNSHTALAWLAGGLIACVIGSGLMILWRYKANCSVIGNYLHARQHYTPRHMKAEPNAYESLQNFQPSAPEASVSFDPLEQQVKIYPNLPGDKRRTASGPDTIQNREKRTRDDMDSNRGRYPPVWNSNSPWNMQNDARQQASQPGPSTMRTDQPTYSRRTIRPTSIPATQPPTNPSPWANTTMSEAMREEQLVNKVTELALAKTQSQTGGLHGGIRQAIQQAELHNYEVNIQLNNMASLNQEIKQDLKEARRIRQDVITIRNNMPQTDQIVQAALEMLNLEPPRELMAVIERKITDDIADTFEQFSNAYDVNLPVNQAQEQVMNRILAGAWTANKKSVFQSIDDAINRTVAKERTAIIRECQNIIRHESLKAQNNCRNCKQQDPNQGSKMEVKQLEADLKQAKTDIDNLRQELKEVQEAIQMLQQEKEPEIETVQDDRETKRKAKAPFRRDRKAKRSRIEAKMKIYISLNSPENKYPEKRKTKEISWTDSATETDKKQIEDYVQQFMQEDKNGQIQCRVTFTGSFPAQEISTARKTLGAKGWTTTFVDLKDNSTSGVLPVMAAFIASITTPHHREGKPGAEVEGSGEGCQLDSVDHCFVQDGSGKWGRIPLAFQEPSKFSVGVLSAIPCSLLLARRITDKTSEEMLAIKTTIQKQKTDTTERLKDVQASFEKLISLQDDKWVQLEGLITTITKQDTTETENINQLACKLSEISTAFRTERSKWEQRNAELCQTQQKIQEALPPQDAEQLIADVMELRRITESLQEKDKRRRQVLRRQSRAIQDIGQATLTAAIRMQDPKQDSLEIMSSLLQEITDEIEEISRADVENTTIKTENPDPEKDGEEPSGMELLSRAYSSIEDSTGVRRESSDQNRAVAGTERPV